MSRSNTAPGNYGSSAMGGMTQLGAPSPPTGRYVGEEWGEGVGGGGMTQLGAPSPPTGRYVGVGVGGGGGRGWEGVG